ncbi:MAG: zinc ribbon domain-containing protein [Clostridia bacterium]|nr:zinc ribbon domain-containing protein [Clostridia bacterium]
MAFCKNCGQELPVDAKACPNCGTAVEVQQAAPQAAPADPKQAPKVKDFTAQFDPKDIADNKVMAILAYLSWLVLIPLLVSPAKDSPYVRFHVNQGLILFIAGLISGVLSFICIGAILGVVCFVFMIIGIINAANGQAKELPWIGKFRILK